MGSAASKLTLVTNKLECFVPEKSLQASLVFADKAKKRAVLAAISAYVYLTLQSLVGAPLGWALILLSNIRIGC